MELKPMYQRGRRPGRPDPRDRGNAMELKPMYQRVIGLDVHQAKISACALAQQPDGTVTITRWYMGFNSMAFPLSTRNKLGCVQLP